MSSTPANGPADELQVRRAEVANEADRIIGGYYRLNWRLSLATRPVWRKRQRFGLGAAHEDPGADSRSGKVRDTHPVGAIYNHNLGVFTVTKIAVENTDAVSPAHPVPRTPKAAYPGLQWCRGPSAPLTCLARPAAWQSLCTGHLDASLKPSALTFTEPGLPERKIAKTSTRPLLGRGAES
jgi:hypothetical protein